LSGDVKRIRGPLTCNLEPNLTAVCTKATEILSSSIWRDFRESRQPYHADRGTEASMDMDGSYTHMSHTAAFR